MLKENYLHKIKELPGSIKEFAGLTLVMIIVILFFAILNNIFGEGDELVAKMKIEEERVAETRKLDSTQRAWFIAKTLWLTGTQ